MTEEHYSPIQTPKQLVIVVLLAFAIPIALAVALSQLVTSGEQGSHENESIVLARIQPVGSIVIAAPSAPKGMLTGEQVYGQVCKTCHEAGLAGAPKIGDNATWAKIVAQGDKLSFAHAIDGFKAMPPKGGNSELTDDEVKRAVVFMANKAGAKWTAPEPVASAAAPAPAGAGAMAAAGAPAQVATATPAAAGAADGKKVYDTGCIACHGAGIAGAPKFGDKAAWAPRIKLGMDALYTAALHGKGAMPPKGGNTTLGDADVKAAVNFMVAASK